MDARVVCLYTGGSLTTLVGLACSFGAWVLRSGNASNWPDVVGSPTALRGTAIGLAITGALLIGASAGVFMRASWGFSAAIGAMLIFVAGGFWGNYAAFGDIRPVHTGTNVVIAAITLVLIWFGYRQTP